MDNIILADKTNLFLNLQAELESGGIGTCSSIEEQRQLIEAELCPFFMNIENLRDSLGLGELTYDYAFLKRTYEWSKPLLSQLLTEYREAQARDQERTFNLLGDFHSITSKACSHAANLAQLQQNKNHLKLPLLAKSCFRDMGDLIESSLYPYLCLRLQLLEISQRIGKVEKRKLTLGSAISKLNSLAPTLYNPEPFQIPLSQWRNIAQHSDYTVVDDKIYCEYGPNHHRKELICSPEQLIDLCTYVDNVNFVHKMANQIFSIDNIKSLWKVLKSSNAECINRSFVNTLDYSSETGLALTGASF